LRILILFFCFFTLHATAQTLGGNAVYNFLKFSYHPALTASGSVNVSQRTNEVGSAMNNPAWLRPALHGQLGISFTEFSGLTAFHLAGAMQHEKSQTTFGGSVTYLNYGMLQQADAAGNSSGSFHAADYVVQLAAGRRYLERWNYGFSARFIHSSYEQYRSTGLAFDAGVLYTDTANGLTMSLLAKNMGLQLRSYAEPEDLPFDLQAGITKKLEKAPFAFSFTLQQLHRFGIFYQDTAFNQENNFPAGNTVFNRLFNHLVLAAQIYIGRNLQASIGYNRLRRNELILGSTGNGLTGFSAGFSAQFEKFHVSFARSSYQRGIAYNQLGINLMMDRLFGLGSQ
jgi:hypothetical protein